MGTAKVCTALLHCGTSLFPGNDHGFALPWTSLPVKAVGGGGLMREVFKELPWFVKSHTSALEALSISECDFTEMCAWAVCEPHCGALGWAAVSESDLLSSPLQFSSCFLTPSVSIQKKKKKKSASPALSHQSVSDSVPLHRYLL